LRSVELETPDVQLSETFYTRVWGLQVVARVGQTIYLRAVGRDHHVLALTSGERSQIKSMTFRASSADDLDGIEQAAQSHGGCVIRRSIASEDPAGGEQLVLREMQGRVIRIVHNDLLHEAELPGDHLPLRLSHVNLNTSDITATTDFFEAVLGFKPTDRSKMMTFVRCNSDHHTVVLARAAVDTLNHIAFMMADCEAVMRGSGRMIDAGYPIGWGVGRHGPGNNIFSYFLDPTGFVIEYTADVLQVDDSYKVGGPDDWTWPPGRTDLWGIAPPKSESVKAAQLAIPFASQRQDR
jgi:catechol 2,3-dioxygenase